MFKNISYRLISIIFILTLNPVFATDNPNSPAYVDALIQQANPTQSVPIDEAKEALQLSEGTDFKWFMLIYGGTVKEVLDSGLLKDAFQYETGQGYTEIKNYFETLPAETRKIDIYSPYCLPLVYPVNISKFTNLKEFYAGFFNSQDAFTPAALRLFAYHPVFKTLENLTVYNSSVLGIPEEIGLLQQLTTLNLTGLNLTYIQPGLASLINLQTLHIIGNRLSGLDPNLGRLTNLKDLQLQSNGITMLPDSLTSLVKLESLNISDNNFGKFPFQITSGLFPKLNTLTLDNCSLSDLPGELAALTSLEVLSASRNNLSSLPKELVQLPLKTLHIDSNTEIAADSLVLACQITSLTELNISNKYTKALPIEIGNLIHLVTLHACCDPLTSVPDSLGNLTSLETLDLEQDPRKKSLTSLPLSVANLSALTRLNLIGTNVTTLPSALNRTSLKILSLNHITFVNGGWCVVQ